MVISVRSRVRQTAVICTIILVAVLALLLWPSLSRAQAWSWSLVPPTVFSSELINDISSVATCPTAYQTRTVAGELDAKKVCVSDDDTIRYGTYYTGHAYVPVVGFGYDSMMYKIKGSPCGQFDDCIYMPESDVLVTRQVLGQYPVRSLVIYKNFAKRLTRALNEHVPVLEYHFNDSNPDYIFESAEGYDWPIGGMGGSKNGQWVALEFRQRGIGVLNIETLEMKRVSTMRFSYGTGYDPTTHLAVSNDGQHVAVGGINAGLTVFDNDPSCGDTATDFRMQEVFPIAQRCQGAQIDTNAFIDRFKDALHPSFNEDGAELRFYAISYNNEQREVILQAAGYTTPRLDYLALGDSFSSGEGETDDTYYQQGTNDEFEKCHTSKRSYPYLIAAELGISPDKVKSVACSGAVTGDIIGEDLNYWGQGKRLQDNSEEPNKIIKVIAQTSAVELFIPGRVHQISFAERYRPRMITVGIGGNDVGFMDKLRTCIGTDTCEWANTAEGREKTALELKRLYNTLVDTYGALHDASPSSKIYAIGYPRIIDQDGQCDILHGLLLNETERTFMNEGITYINDIVESAAKKVGIAYLDIENTLGNQVLCGPNKPSVMNGITLGDDSALNEKTKWLKLIGNEGFHPRPSAHILEAQSILHTIPNLLSYAYCADNSVICPNNAIDAPNPSNYWLVDGITHDYASQQLADIIEYNGQRTIISTKERTFLPNSAIIAEVRSDPVNLGILTADSSGKLIAEVTLPATLAEGFHTIHLYGTSYSGEAIDLYQVIKHQYPDTIDEEVSILNHTESTSTDVTDNAQTVESNIAPGQIAYTMPSSDSRDLISLDADTAGNKKEPIDITNPSHTPHFGNELVQTNSLEIPAIALLFMGTGIALYARLRRNR